MISCPVFPQGVYGIRTPSQLRDFKANEADSSWGQDNEGGRYTGVGLTRALDPDHFHLSVGPERVNQV